MSLLLLVHFDVKPAEMESFVNGLISAKPLITGAEGCEGVEVLTSTERPNTVVLSEVWQSKVLHDQYEEKMSAAGGMGQLAAKLNGEPRSEFFEIK